MSAEQRDVVLKQACSAGRTSLISLLHSPKGAASSSRFLEMRLMAQRRSHRTHLTGPTLSVGLARQKSDPPAHTRLGPNSARNRACADFPSLLSHCASESRLRFTSNTAPTLFSRWMVGRSIVNAPSTTRTLKEENL